MLDINSFAFDGTEKDYRELKAYHYSLLSKFEKGGFSSLPTLFDKEESTGFTFGNLVDTLMTDADHFPDKFYICDLPKVSDTLYAITEQLVEAHSHNDRMYLKYLKEISDEEISYVCVQNNYYTADKYAKTRVNNVRKECSDLYYQLHQAHGRTILTNKDYFKGTDAEKALRGTPEIAKYITETDTYKVYNQVKLRDTVTLRGKEYNIKCMLDYMGVDEENKIIYPMDLKTSSFAEWEFPRAFKMFQYWIQSELYWQTLNNVLKKTPGTEGYSIADFQFIVINKDNLSPMMWTDKNCVMEDDYKIGWKNYRHWSHIMEELDLYLTEEHKYPLSMKAQGNSIIEALEDYGD